MLRRTPGEAAAPEGFLPLCVPEIRGNEWKYLKDCLDTGWVSSVGAYVDRFERAVADRVGARHAVAVVNGTAALPYRHSRVDQPNAIRRQCGMQIRVVQQYGEALFVSHVQDPHINTDANHNRG